MSIIKAFISTVKYLVITILIIISVFIAGFIVGKTYYKSQNPLPLVEEEKKNDKSLITEKKVVTENDVEAKITEIGELSTYMGDYLVKRTIENSRYFIDEFEIPGTTNTIKLYCNGIVKISYNLSDIEIAVTEKTIFIGLPEAYVSDNYLIWDKVKCNETNNPLNPISFDDYKGLIEDIEKEGLKKAEEEGIYDAADKNVKKIITHFLEVFDGYEIKFL